MVAGDGTILYLCPKERILWNTWLDLPCLWTRIKPIYDSMPVHEPPDEPHGMIKKKKPKKKDFKRSTYVDTLDSVFSHYIRQKYADVNGMVKCYTCDVVAHWRDMQCGHYFSRKNLSTRWDVDGCRIQCRNCNVFQHGNYPVYGVRLATEIGAEKMMALEIKHNKTVKFSNLDLLDMAKGFYHILRWPHEISHNLRTQLLRIGVIEKSWHWYFVVVSLYWKFDIGKMRLTYYPSVLLLYDNLLSPASDFQPGDFNFIQQWNIRN